MLNSRIRIAVASFLAIALTLTATIVSTPQLGTAAERVYHSSTSTTVQGRDVVVATTQQGIEVLEIENDRLVKRGEANQPGAVTIGSFARGEDVFVAAGSKILKFDISDINWPVLDIQKNYPGYAHDISGSGSGSIAIGGTQGLTLHTPDSLDTIKKLFVYPVYGVNKNAKGNTLFNTEDEVIVVKENGFITHRQSVEGTEKWLRTPYSDGMGNHYSSGDDRFIKLASSHSFSNWSGTSYGVDGIDTEPFVYGVNGWGVYKLTKADMRLREFTSINERGGWATSVNAFKSTKGIRVVVTAKTFVYLLDENLNVLDRYSYQPYPGTGDVVLSTAQAQLASPKGKALSTWTNLREVRYGESFSAFGAGFWPGEEVIAEFGPSPSKMFQQKPSKIYPNQHNIQEKGWADANGNVKVPNIYVREFSAKRVSADEATNMHVTLHGQNSGFTTSVNIYVLPARPVVEDIADEDTEDATETSIVEVQRRCEKTIEKTTEDVIKNGKVVTIEKVVETSTCKEEITQ
ncbi:MAG: hypothetical protein HN424_02545 [Candidatus Jacksonbacteria bacterium]|nr:hypothetical protein [Candidatus Jacksonbacteria bacterium]